MRKLALLLAENRVSEATPRLKPFIGDYMKNKRKIKEMSDEEMVGYLRKSMVDPSEPSPSVESFLHAFIPHAYVDHSHSDAILSSTAFL